MDPLFSEKQLNRVSREELIDQERGEMILKMKKSGKLSNEDIAEFTGFTVKEVEAVSEENTVNCIVILYRCVGELFQHWDNYN